MSRLDSKHNQNKKKITKLSFWEIIDHNISCIINKSFVHMTTGTNIDNNLVDGSN